MMPATLHVTRTRRAAIYLRDGCACVYCGRKVRLDGLTKGRNRALSAGIAAGDQKRVATPASAIRDGASHLVVARPILNAADPRQAARDIIGEITDADKQG